ncbi:hypothetical protein HDU67_001341 [Dinochytrium kinnereticum]|nr:hypothetical protein HDU67_001341 [Dinochytrium kinnereticum]
MNIKRCLQPFAQRYASSMRPQTSRAFRFDNGTAVQPNDSEELRLKRKPADTPLPSPESLRIQKPRIEWYNDPHLLARRVTTLLENDEDQEYILNLVERHTGSSNEVVYGALIGGLVKKKLYSLALDAFKDMKRKKLTLTHRTFTALFKANAMMAAMSPRDVDQIRSRFVDLLSLWRKIDPESRNIYHVNAVLAACSDMVSAGGVEAGLGLFSVISSSCRKKGGLELPPLLEANDASLISFELPEDHAIKPDIVTFTSVLRLCAKHGGQDGFSTAKFLWEKEIPASRVKVDGPLVTSMILCCEKSSADEGLQYGAKLAVDFFSLAPAPEKELPTKRRPQKSRLELREASFDVIIRLACKLKDWDLGYACILRATDLRLKLDFISSSNAVTVLLKKGRFEEAWRVTQRIAGLKESDGQRVDALKLKVYSVAKADAKGSARGFVPPYDEKWELLRRVEPSPETEKAEEVVEEDNEAMRPPLPKRAAVQISEDGFTISKRASLERRAPRSGDDSDGRRPKTPSQ